MSTITPLLKEMEMEAQTTRKMLERVPTAYFSWQPHKKSMTVQQLATHIAELPGWVTMAVTTDGLDFAANPYKQEDIHNTIELLDYFDRSLADGRTHLKATTEDKLAETCNTYLKKGMSCLVEGRLSIRSYETKEGEKRKATEVVCNTMQMLDRAGGGGSRMSEDGESSYSRPAPSRAPASAATGFDEDAALEDEIPF